MGKVANRRANVTAEKSPRGLRFAQPLYIRAALKSGIMAKTQAKQLVVCVDNDGYAASLEKRKIYVALRDATAEKHDLLRVVDESGEDYLYPKAFFRALPQAVRRAVLAAA